MKMQAMNKTSKPTGTKPKRITDFFASTGQNITSTETPTTSATLHNEPVETTETKQSESNRATRLRIAKFKNSWKSEFPWLQFTNGAMTCSYCIKAGKQNVFTSGCRDFVKDYIQKHAKLRDHRDAIRTKLCHKDFEVAAVKAYSKEKDAIIAAMRTAFYLAKKHRPIDDMSDLITLQIKQGVESLKILNVDKHTTYTSSSSVLEMQQSMAKVQIEEVLDEIKAAKLFGLMIDESTDRSSQQTLMIYVKYVHAGQPQTRFLTVVELAGSGTADKIYDTLLQTLTELQLDCHYLVGIATDGASVMTGCVQGVTTKLQRLVPHLLAIHCIAHRLSLALSKACHSISLFDKYQRNVNAIYKYYYYSPKRQHTLKEMQRVLDLPELKFQEVFDSRWMSFELAINALSPSLDALISALVLDQDTGNSSTTSAKAKGLLNAVASFEFLAATAFFSDVLQIFGILTRIFQTQNISPLYMQTSLDAAMASIESMKIMNGPKLQTFLNSIPDAPGNSFQFGEAKHEIKESKTKREQFFEAKKQYLNALLSNLQTRFQKISVIEKFSILFPKNLPNVAHNTKEFVQYGTEELVSLTQFYDKSNLFSSSGTILTDQAKCEFSLLKNIMKRNYTSCSFSDFAIDLLTNNDLNVDYPIISQLMKIYLSVPLSTVDCERGFSQYNLNKTSIRNRLKTSTINNLMLLAIDTPNIVNMDRFNFEKAYQKWCSARDRRISL